MPAFGEHVPEDQIWQLVAYVRSMSGQLRSDVAGTRSDTLQAAEPESRRKKEEPKHEATPSAEQ
jgi:cytochrome c oxidase cbb3-type subunit 3